MDAAGATYPGEVAGPEVLPTTGESFLGAAEQATGAAGIYLRSRPIFWEHEGNRALRDGPWKLVSRYPNEWELYNIDEDRTELHDLAAGERDRLAAMIAEYDGWADRSRVAPWPVRR
jgi:arylsulfatase